MKLSRTVAYAVQAILQLSASPIGSPVACGQLAARGKMPERFLLQILRKLVRSGVLTSHRGVDGGYVLAKSPESISLLDVFESFDTPLIPSVPPLDGLSDVVRDRMLETLQRSCSAVRAELAALKMSDLVADETIGLPISPNGAEA
ncbi:MAG: Rrf2 family transcriptional regulator [Planctomycetota bacterium]